MNLTQLQYFLEVSKYGTFSKAAKQIGITQPALSLQILKLEEELEFKLFDRSKKPLELTPEGMLLLSKATEIVHLVDHLKEISLELSEEVKGNLKIGIIPTLSPYLVPLFIQQINDRYPGLSIQIEELQTEIILNRLKAGDLDAGILSTPLDAKGIFFRPLFYEQFFLYVSEKHEFHKYEEIDFKTINQEEIWYLQEGNCFRNQVNAICTLSNRNPQKESLLYLSNSIESLRRIVDHRGGMTFIPELATIEIPAEQEEFIKPLKGQPPVREISLALSRLQIKEKLINALIAVLLENIPSRMKRKPNSWIVDTGLKLK